MADRYLTVAEVSEYLQLPVMTVYMHARTGALPASKLGKHWRFSLRQLEDWLARNQNMAEAGSAALGVLVIDDEPGAWEMLSEWFGEAGCAVYRASSDAEAKRILAARGVDVVIVNPMAANFGGLATLRQVREMAPQTVLSATPVSGQSAYCSAKGGD